jgi:hypothetical protein
MVINRQTVLNAFGALVLSAFALAAVHAFCEVALADELPAAAPSFDAPTVVLGTYRVASIVKTEQHKKTDLCTSDDKTLRDDACFTHVWAVKNGKQLAFLRAPLLKEASEYYSGSILDGLAFQKACSQSTDVFEFSANVPEIAKLPNDEVTSVAKIFLFASSAFTDVETGYIIAVPHGEVSPKSIQIQKVTTGSMLLLLRGIDVDQINYKLVFESN